MKKLCLISLLVVGFSFQYGNGQTGYLSGGKLGSNSDRHLLQECSSKGQNCAAVATHKGQNRIEEGTSATDQKPNAPAESQKDSQLDPATEQMVEAAITQLSEESQTSLRDSTQKSIEEYVGHDRDITAALSTIKGDKTAF
jgi:hypothetical protein